MLLEVRNLVKFLLHLKDAKEFPAGNLVILTINIRLQEAEKVRAFWQFPNVANTPRKPVHWTIKLHKIEQIIISPMMPETSVSKPKAWPEKDLMGKKHTICM